MHSTKTEILALLKRSDGATVDELSTTLGLASMTVRQHLTALERDTLVRAEEVRRPMGRPHFRYRLTDSGHREVAEGHDRLVGLLVEQAGETDAAATPDERRRALFRRAAAALAARHQAELTGQNGDRVERAVTVLRQYGGFPEWHEAGGQIEVRDFGCVFRTYVGKNGACEWHQTFLTAVFGVPAYRGAPPGDGCADCCCYIIQVGAEAPAETRGT
jgi:predicted ArsR family transcriptional regulator